MRQNQIELKEEYSELSAKYRKLMPEVGTAYREMAEEVYKDGVLSGKIKRMMGMVAALTHGCVGCIIYQVDVAISLGATAEEILEACAVAISLGGTMSVAATTHVTKLLEDRGLI